MLKNTQNSFSNDKIIKSLLDKTNISNDDIIIEITASLGTISKQLLNRCSLAYLVELEI